ncbi:MAG TPA: 2TM domain-containing protein [Methylocystis sp.]|nr:2TM domain-containing protein [Methylocystis sp.]
MNPNANSGQLRADEALALAKVQESKRFYIHLAQYLTTVAVLAAINVFLTPRAIWAPFVAVGWGLSVIFHGLRVFDRIPVFTPAWEKRRVEALLGRKL